MIEAGLALLLLYGIPLLWGLDAVLAGIGVVRHGYRATQARRDRDAIRRAHQNGLLAWAVDSNLMGERCRAGLKLGLCAFALLRLSVQWERLDLLAPEWDWRDVVQPLLYLLVVLLLTHWSNWEAQHRPKREAVLSPVSVKEA